MHVRAGPIFFKNIFSNPFQTFPLNKKKKHKKKLGNKGTDYSAFKYFLWT